MRAFYEQCLWILQHFPLTNPDLHHRLLAEKGVYFTIGVEVLFSAAIQEIARSVPSSLLLTETDNPGGYHWLTGDPGMPSIIIPVVHKLAELRGWSAEETQAIVLHNFLRLVGDDDWAKRIKTRSLQ